MADKNLKRSELQDKYFEQIKKAKKTVEGRINDGDYKEIKVGGFIEFHRQSDKNDKLMCEVIGATAYTGFEEMLTAEGLNKCLPGVVDIPAGVEVYHSIGTYRQRAEQKGVIAFRLKPVS